MSIRLALLDGANVAHDNEALHKSEYHTTERLMAQFYSQLANHQRKVDALRVAQMELLDKGVPPYYWASFQVVGDPNGTI
jgi:hypothetical protein